MGDDSYFTVCYLTFAVHSRDTTRFVGSGDAVDQERYIQEDDHIAFRQTLDPSTLVISEKQRYRFSKAMKQLGITPCYHLSELEAHVIHPIEDETLADICPCRDSNCPGACYDIHSWDRPSCLESFLEGKSRGEFSMTLWQ
jgi:hypothetical protein